MMVGGIQVVYRRVKRVQVGYRLPYYNAIIIIIIFSIFLFSFFYFCGASGVLKYEKKRNFTKTFLPRSATAIFEFFTKTFLPRSAEKDFKIL